MTDIFCEYEVVGEDEESGWPLVEYTDSTGNRVIEAVDPGVLEWE